MKTNNFHTGNLLRDLYLQNCFHGREFRDTVCFRFGWSIQSFKQHAVGSRLFLLEDALDILSIQYETMQTRLHYTEDCMKTMKKNWL